MCTSIVEYAIIVYSIIVSVKKLCIPETYGEAFKIRSCDMLYFIYNDNEKRHQITLQSLCAHRAGQRSADRTNYSERGDKQWYTRNFRIWSFLR